MSIRATIVCCCLLSSACGPQPGDTTDTVGTTSTATSSGGTATTETSTTTTSGTTTPTTGGTGTSGDTTTDATTSTSGDTTEATTEATTTTGTTGVSVCEDIVGSQDCAALVAISGDLSLETCMKCQGTACGQVSECDTQFPCVDDVIVIQGCCTDEQCAGLSPFCGMFIAADNVCVLSDDV